MIRVSVIIPNYNHAVYLTQRIDSVLNQTFQDFEVIILDDCSSDNSKDIIEKYRGHSKVSKIVFNTTNSGTTFKQWQKGINLAKGNYIWIAESDDWCEPTLLENLMIGMTEDTALAFCQSLMIHDSSKILWNSRADFYEEQLDGQKFIKQKMLKRNAIINASMCIFRKDLFFNINADFTHYKFCGDWLFWVDIASQGQIFISGKILNYFRKHEKDVSGSAYLNGKMYTEYFQLLEDFVKRDVIDKVLQNQLLIDKFKELVYDNRVENSIYKKIKKSFYRRIHKSDYLTLLSITAASVKFKFQRRFAHRYHHFVV